MDYYLQEFTPEQILEELRSLNLEKIQATITYYLHNRPFRDSWVCVALRTVVTAGRRTLLLPW